MLNAALRNILDAIDTLDASDYARFREYATESDFKIITKFLSQTMKCGDCDKVMEHGEKLMRVKFDTSSKYRDDEDEEEDEEEYDDEEDEDQDFRCEQCMEYCDVCKKHYHLDAIKSTGSHEDCGRSVESLQAEEDEANKYLASLKKRKARVMKSAKHA